MSEIIMSSQGYDPLTGYWNDSLRGDFLWTNVNVAEARPDVMTPLTWTFGEMIRRENQPMPGNQPFVGNIAGRVYLNISLTFAMFRAIGLNPKRMANRFEELFGPIPEGVEVPPFRLPVTAFFAIFPEMRKIRRKESTAPAKIPAFLMENPARCHQMLLEIQDIHSGSGLVDYWQQILKPYFLESAFIVTGGARPYALKSGKLRRQLVKLVGQADANALLSDMSTENELLASLGPVAGIARVAQGKMSRAEYQQQYGHRGPHEMELSIPRPAEDPAWLNRQLAEFQDNPVDVEGMLAGRRFDYEAAWKRFVQRYPRKTNAMSLRLAEIPRFSRQREATRSEATRIYAVIRAWALRAGELTGLEQDIFFLTFDELIRSLIEDEKATGYIPARREMHARLSALPPYPTIIRGYFDPFSWASDAGRRSDIFIAQDSGILHENGVIKGYPGASGIAVGVVRVLHSPEESDRFHPGEVLVAVTTNVGWTPLFPRAAAVVTDVGAPLSHAAIVARELGIPAVVGCVNATSCLKTGDRVRIDGGQGTVEIIKD
jgi:pyruvate,water dikinase